MKAQLARLYVSLVGYDPFADSPSITEQEVLQTLREWVACVCAEYPEAAKLPDVVEVLSIPSPCGGQIVIHYAPAKSETISVFDGKLAGPAKGAADPLQVRFAIESCLAERCCGGLLIDGGKEIEWLVL